MRLRDLDAKFVRVEIVVEEWTRVREDGEREQVVGPRVHMPIVDDIAEAQGIMFLCPLCFAKNRGEVGTHSVLCWFARSGVPDDLEPLPGRWVPDGTELDDLTFIGPAAASVRLTGGCRWHGFVKRGDAT